MSTSPVIRLTLTPEIQAIINYLKSLYPLLSEAEIVKLALGGYYQYVKPATNFNSVNSYDSQNAEYEAIKQQIQNRTQNKFSNVQFSQEEIDDNSF